MEPRIVTVYLGLGANLGDRAGQIRWGLRRLEERGALTVARVSSLYETEPVGWSGGPWYLNGAAMGQTTLSPGELLRALKETEAEVGREMETQSRNAPRPLDLDLLLYGEEKIRTATLVVPHPRIAERGFVLLPLAEIAPEIEVAPGLAAEAAAKLPRKEVVRPWRPAEQEEEQDAALCV